MVRVLVIEDQAAVRDIVADVLREFEVADSIGTEASLEAARHALEQGHWDAVVTDMSLPDGNVLDMMDDMRQLGQILPPTILMSGFLGNRVAQRAGALGIEYIMAKPFSPVRLVEVVQKVLS